MKNSTHRSLKKNGFSLVELIIVVAILGILAAIAVPAYRNYITTGKQSAARSVLEQFPILVETYRAETGRICPACNTAGVHTYTYTEDASGNWNTGADAIKTAYPDFRAKGNNNDVSIYHYQLVFNVVGGNVTAAATAQPQVARGAPPGDIPYSIE